MVKFFIFRGGDTPTSVTLEPGDELHPATVEIDHIEVTAGDDVAIYVSEPEGLENGMVVVKP